jgi:hypothetical protein
MSEVVGYFCLLRITRHLFVFTQHSTLSTFLFRQPSGAIGGNTPQNTLFCHKIGRLFLYCCHCPPFCQRRRRNKKANEFPDSLLSLLIT